ncbi:MAG: geranylgeranylglyceryl/heptaprenylglyceryl phosphate synthase [Flavobacterium sp.]|mgnify:CR=1 FL=1|nr:geranylgeranylglyceryl/heptaprenylglyceryl phosphate synthase [Flavobacterium sp.]
MKKLYQEIVDAKANNKKLLAILIDPDKVALSEVAIITAKINRSPATHIFLGGSTVETTSLDALVELLKQQTALPIILFPGNPSQIAPAADGILFLSLISGRNADYLIEHQVNAVPLLRATNLEIIPTGYILIESGSETAVARVSKTTPLSRSNHEYVLQTAQAGVMLGKKLIYLEAGSGAKIPVPLEMISLVSNSIAIPLIVGGGIKGLNEIQNAYKAGADLVVIGNAFEENLDFFN